MRKLPEWIEFRRDRITGSWRWTCRACGIIETFSGFWPASATAHEHAAMHLAEEEGSPCTSAGAPG